MNGALSMVTMASTIVAALTNIPVDPPSWERGL